MLRKRSIIDGNFNTTIFIIWFEKLIKKIKSIFKDQPCTIVLDNASIHNKNLIFELVEKYKIYVNFLPPYSPELNPIEKFWGVMKNSIRGLFSLDSNQSFDNILAFFLQKYHFETC